MYDRCICCGTIIPEGLQVCYNCSHDAELNSYVELNNVLDKISDILDSDVCDNKLVEIEKLVRRYK